jgi:hypothetical protein
METAGMQKQFEMTRSKLQEIMEGLSEAEADFQPEGFNNTIRWQLGHLLVSAESFLFGYPGSHSPLSKLYGEFFSSGTAPKNWQRSAPSLDDIKSNYLSQEKRIKELPQEYWGEEVTGPLTKFNIKTKSELFHMLLNHEAMHLGQIQSIKKIVKQHKTTNQY